jgi:multidrug resistance efflux pump
MLRKHVLPTLRKFLLPAAAVGLLLFAVLYVVHAQQEPPKPPPPIDPARTPFRQTVAGAGIVEAQTENISIGSALPGVVTKVAVKVGNQVRAGDLLFELDDRQLRAELEVRQAALVAAQAQLKKQEELPRPEELPASAAKVHEAEANLADKVDQYERARVLYSRRAMAEEDVNLRRQAAAQAREQLARARADYALLRAGAWEPDKAIARAAVVQARSQVEQTQTELERLKVRALVSGEVLQVNVRPGEFVGAPPGQALIVLGNVDKKHVRVDIDEHDIPRFRPGAPARALVRGNPGKYYPLTFVRVEPYVIPKKSLTGDNTERVDTRVLQVIYALEPGTQGLYVGQQMDVFIDSKAPAGPGKLSLSG